MNSMFDRLGDFLRDYIDEDQQDIFSNPEEETVENSNTTSTQENFTENVKQESYQTKTESKPKQEFKSETQSKTQKQTQSEYKTENKKTEFKFGNQDTYQNFFTSNNSNKTNSSNKTEKPNTQKAKVSQKVFVPFELHPDFKTLCVVPGTSLEECKFSYKSLLKKYHPDRFANDEKKQKEATEITSSITTAFNRIKTWYETNLPK